MKTLTRINGILNQVLMVMAAIFLVGMVVLTCGNIIFRITWVPIRGTFELMGFFGAMVTAFALGYTQMKKGHIAVDVLVNRFPKKVQKGLQLINNTIGTIFFAVAAWQIAVKATTLLKTGEVTETLRIIYYPFTYAVAGGCLVLSLVLLTTSIELFAAKKNEDAN